MSLLGTIRGTPLLGFADAFDAAHGDPKTPQPYAKVTPSRVGEALLPFRCPHCQRVLTQFSLPGSRECYRDPKKGHYWCPACRARMMIDVKGMPLPTALPAWAIVAPSKVDRAGVVTMQDEAQQAPEALEALGAWR